MKYLITTLLLVTYSFCYSQDTSWVYNSNAFVEGVDTGAGYGYTDDTVYQPVQIISVNGYIEVRSSRFFWKDEIIKTTEPEQHPCGCGVYITRYYTTYGRYTVSIMDAEIINIEYVPFELGTCMNFTYTNQY